MDKLLLGIGLLVALLCLGMGVAYFAQTVHIPVSDTLAEAAQLALAGDPEKALEMAQNARQLWDRRWRGSATFSDHAPMDEIDGLFAQLEIYGQAGRNADMAALCARLSQLLQAMAEAQSPAWWNLL